MERQAANVPRSSNWSGKSCGLLSSVRVETGQTGRVREGAADQRQSFLPSSGSGSCQGSPGTASADCLPPKAPKAQSAAGLVVRSHPPQPPQSLTTTTTTTTTVTRCSGQQRSTRRPAGNHTAAGSQADQSGPSAPHGWPLTTIQGRHVQSPQCNRSPFAPPPPPGRDRATHT